MKNIFLTAVFLISVLANSAHAKIDSPDEIIEVDNSLVIDRINNNDIQVIMPSMLFTFADADIKIKFVNPNHTKLLLNRNKIEFIINGENKVLDFVNGEACFKHRFKDSKTLSIYAEDFSYSRQVTAYPLWAFILPLVLIILYVIKRALKK